MEPVDKGWSTDKKYHIKTLSGEHLLLRLSSIEEYENKKKEFEIIEKYAKLGFQMSMPKEFGACNGNQNTYMLLRMFPSRQRKRRNCFNWQSMKNPVFEFRMMK